MRVDQVVPARVLQRAHQAERFHAPAAFARLGEERRAFARQQRGFDAGGGETLDEPQHLPLSSAHLLAGVEVQDAHQLMILALEYFRNV